MTEPPTIVYRMPANGRLFLTPAETAAALLTTPKGLRSLMRIRTDLATIALLRGKSKRGHGALYHARAVEEARGLLEGRPWPAPRRTLRTRDYSGLPPVVRDFLREVDRGRAEREGLVPPGP